MAVAYATSAKAAAENSQTITITKPSSLAAGDLLVAMLCNRGAQTWNTPSGWTAKGTASVSNQRMACFVKVADSADAAASNFTFQMAAGTTFESVGVLLRLTGTFTDGNNVTATTSDTDASPDTGDIFVFSNTSLTPIANAFLVAGVGAEASNASATTVDAISVATDNPTWTEREFQGQPNEDDLIISVATASRSQTTNIGATTADFDSTGNLSNGTVIIIAIHETANVTINPAVVTITGNIIAPTVTAAALVSPAVITMQANINAPTVTTADPEWVNTDKNTASWFNTDKS